jgi:hypothetical protein
MHMNPNVDKILKAAQALDERAARQSKSTKQGQLRRTTIEQGLLEKPPPRGNDSGLASDGITLTVPRKPTAKQIARFNAWKPVEMPGGPLSDDIIRDRR